MASYADLLKKKSNEWGAPDMLSRAKQNVAKIPFSSPMLNYATYGGIPRSRITEFHGNPGGGKSTTAIDICKNARDIFTKEHEDAVDDYRSKVASGKKEYAGPLEDLIDAGPKKVLYVDLEHSFDYSWASKMNLSEGDLDVMQPPDTAAEEILQLVEDIVCTGEVGLIVLDSIPSLVTRAELDKKLGERTVASLAGLMTNFLRKVVPLLTRYDCTLLLINQVRPNMENPYVVNTPGGEAIKFYSSLRLLFRLGSPLDFSGNEVPASTEDPAGYLVNVKVVKQKAAPFDRKVASYYLMAKTGIRADIDYARLAINKYHVIQKSGGWFTMCDPNTGEILEDDTNRPIKVQGLVKVFEYLHDHPDYFDVLRSYITSQIEGEGPEGV